MADTEIDLATIRQFLSYDPETGVFVRIKRSPRGRKADVGKPAGYLQKDSGYRVIWISGRAYLEHRLAWAFVHQEFPSAFIDHINRNRSDNRICNLRVVSPAENNQNRAAKRPNKTGFAGVSRHHRRYAAVISIGKGVQKRVGYFDTPEEAHACYMEHKRRLHPLGFAESTSEGIQQ